MTVDIAREFLHLIGEQVRDLADFARETGNDALSEDVDRIRMEVAEALNAHLERTHRREAAE